MVSPTAIETIRYWPWRKGFLKAMKLMVGDRMRFGWYAQVYEWLPRELNILKLTLRGNLEINLTDIYCHCNVPNPG